MSAAESGWRRTALRCLTRAANCADSFMRGAGNVLSVAVVLLVFLCTQQYFAILVAPLVSVYGGRLVAVWTIGGMWLLFNVAFHFYRAAMIGPGNPPPSLSADVLVALRDDPVISPEQRLEDPAAVRFCVHCNQAKPMRAHHCSVCRRCVLKMDHHCPWINNCVGFRNAGHFFFFLLHLSLVSGFFLVSLWKAPSELLPLPAAAEFVAASLVAAVGALAGSMFTAWNTYLIVRNVTTIEYQAATCGGAAASGRRMHSAHRNPYDMGLWKNVTTVLGPSPWLWWLPRALPPAEAGAGLVFPRLPEPRFYGYETTMEDLLDDT